MTEPIELYARELLEFLTTRPRKAYELAELSALTFQQTHETLEWLRCNRYVERLDVVGELYPEWVALRSFE